jgi:hypothetical protein
MKTKGGIQMKKMQDASGAKVVKSKGGLKIHYIPVPAMNTFAKKQLALSKWQQQQEARIEKLVGTQNWEREMHRFRTTLLKKKSELLRAEIGFEAKRARSLPEPLFRPYPPSDYGIDRIFSLTHWRHADLLPDEISIGHSFIDDDQIVFEPSNLIYPCPDDGNGERWSAWFKNNAVELYRNSRHTITGDGFTGQMKIGMRERAEGVADISSGGYVSLGVGAAVLLWRNIGSAQQPQWRLVDSRSSGTALPHIRTTATGLVSLEPAESWHYWEFSEASPGDVVETRQHVYVTAVAAEVQMGYNRQDCASGNGVGYIYTSIPSLDLQYFNLVKPRLNAIPGYFPWS